MIQVPIICVFVVIGLVVLLAFLAACYCGLYNKYKGRYVELKNHVKEEQEVGGWENEARFWRLHFDKESALKLEELG